MSHTHISKPFPEAIEKSILRLDGKEIRSTEKPGEILGHIKDCHQRLADVIKRNEKDKDFCFVME